MNRRPSHALCEGLVRRAPDPYLSSARVFFNASSSEKRLSRFVGKLHAVPFGRNLQRHLSPLTANIHKLRVYLLQIEPAHLPHCKRHVFKPRLHGKLLVLHATKRTGAALPTQSRKRTNTFPSKSASAISNRQMPVSSLTLLLSRIPTTQSRRFSHAAHVPRRPIRLVSPTHCRLAATTELQT